MVEEKGAGPVRTHPRTRQPQSAPFILSPGPGLPLKALNHFSYLLDEKAVDKDSGVPSVCWGEGTRQTEPGWGCRRDEAGGSIAPQNNRIAPSHGNAWADSKGLALETSSDAQREPQHLLSWREPGGSEQLALAQTPARGSPSHQRAALLCCPCSPGPDLPAQLLAQFSIFSM